MEEGEVTHEYTQVHPRSSTMSWSSDLHCFIRSSDDRRGGGMGRIILCVCLSIFAGCAAQDAPRAEKKREVPKYREWPGPQRGILVLRDPEAATAASGEKYLK